MNFSPDSAVAVPKPKHSMLPVLVVLFLVSYGLLALLVVEQSQTIDAQRYLIHALFGDSSELIGMKMRAQKQAQAKARAQAQAQPKSGKSSNNNDRTAKRRNTEKPPKAASDAADVRRLLMSI